ncbi:MULTISPECIES: hypothetical protein [unclassified Mesorhizobium]|uniref:hypothetical protein n=1 Tax=unclassified Mesorhizobium TaxID=325217 RepID=UPI00333D2E9C
MGVIGFKRAFMREITYEGLDVIASAEDEVYKQRVESIHAHFGGGIGVCRFRQRPQVVPTIDFTDLHCHVLGSSLFRNLLDYARHSLPIDVVPRLANWRRPGAARVEQLGERRRPEADHQGRLCQDDSALAEIPYRLTLFVDLDKMHWDVGRSILSVPGWGIHLRPEHPELLLKHLLLVFLDDLLAIGATRLLEDEAVGAQCEGYHVLVRQRRSYDPAVDAPARGGNPATPALLQVEFC